MVPLDRTKVENYCPESLFFLLLTFSVLYIKLERPNIKPFELYRSLLHLTTKAGGYGR